MREKMVRRETCSPTKEHRTCSPAAAAPLLTRHEMNAVDIVSSSSPAHTHFTHPSLDHRRRVAGILQAESPYSTAAACVHA